MQQTCFFTKFNQSSCFWSVRTSRAVWGCRKNRVCPFRSHQARAIEGVRIEPLHDGANRQGHARSERIGLVGERRQQAPDAALVEFCHTPGLEYVRDELVHLKVLLFTAPASPTLPVDAGDAERGLVREPVCLVDARVGQRSRDAPGAHEGLELRAGLVAALPIAGDRDAAQEAVFHLAWRFDWIWDGCLFY